MFFQYTKTKALKQIIYLCVFHSISLQAGLTFTGLGTLGFQLSNYSGRKLIRFGSAVAWSFLISFAVTLQESSVSERRFCSAFRWRRPALDTRELETFRETKAVKPANQVHEILAQKGRYHFQFLTGKNLPDISSKVLSVRLAFWERLRSVRALSSLIFFTPTSVIDPPHASRDSRFLKSEIAQTMSTYEPFIFGERMCCTSKYRKH